MNVQKSAAELEQEIFRLEEEIRSREALRQQQPQLPPMVEIEEFVRKNPILAVAIAITLGVSVGYLLRNMNASSGLIQKFLSGGDGSGEGASNDLVGMILKLMK